MKVVVLEHFTSLPEGAGPAGLVEEGRAMRDAVAADLLRLPGIEVLVVEHGRLFREALRASRAALVIAPAAGGVLETRCREVEEERRLLLGPSAASVRLASDKLLTCRCLGAAGVAMPRTDTVPFASAHGRLRALTLPFVVKPRDGCGGRGVILVRRRAAIGAAIAALRKATQRRDFLVQEYVEGDAASVSILARDRADPGDRSALLPLGLNRQTGEWRDSFAYLGGETMAATAAVAALARAAPGVRGYLGVDLVLGRAGATVIEVNPRLTTSYIGLRRSVGENLARLVLDAATGRPLPVRVAVASRHRFRADGTTVMLTGPGRAATGAGAVASRRVEAWRWPITSAGTSAASI
ncbi:MAG: hypothetical protein AUH92_06620 [Acidobacteria bacterium 13_1_40CM_4_69_4]|nr:MAG: hypothetical protein AUH92_06620 [Acidobacteria bacterium 13_1_40CM_4_69_4]